MNFEKFVASGFRNAWIEEPGIDLYVRRGWWPETRGDYELGNLQAHKPGKGALTKFLDKYEPKYRFFIENILENPRLEEYFKRRGYMQTDSIIPCYLGPRNTRQMEDR
jgi:hypothetical protein